MCGGVGACSQVKLSRMGQAVQTAIGVEMALLAQLVLSLKCLELPQKVELGVNVCFFAQATCWISQSAEVMLIKGDVSPAVRLAKRRSSVTSHLRKAWNHQPRVCLINDA